jgi:hypothetical protein
MAAAELQNRNSAAPETEVQELSDKVTRQVFEILEGAEEQVNKRQPARPMLAYRVPSPGVRYYF